MHKDTHTHRHLEKRPRNLVNFSLSSKTNNYNFLINILERKKLAAYLTKLYYKQKIYILDILFN